MPAKDQLWRAFGEAGHLAPAAKEREKTQAAEEGGGWLRDGRPSEGGDSGSIRVAGSNIAGGLGYQMLRH